MITPLVLLNRPTTSRTPFGRGLHERLTSFLLLSLEPSVGSIVVLAACLSLMPLDVVNDA
jgi:hypothetical protein